MHDSASNSLLTLKFDNRFVHELPADPVAENSRRQVHKACFSKVKPTKVANPTLIAYAKEVSEILDLDHSTCSSNIFTETFAGNHVLPAMEPFAMCYGGHQFGNWAGQLGDGRAINLGEVINKNNERWVLQLKGAGPTPYSRRADGLAVLRSSVREFLCSESMHHLGVPTTRALSLISTGEMVERDMFYDGHPADEPGAVVCRVSPSFIRFGNFEIFTARGDKDRLQQLVDYTINTDFPHLDLTDPEVYQQWFTEICSRTAEMIVHWMRVGFVHGVMNTDNMSILGLTIDYGPYGWMENYDPGWTPNTTDFNGKRYSFGNQAYIGLWNLTQLANALHPLLEDADLLQEILNTAYREHFLKNWRNMMAAKIGLKQFQTESDETLINGLLDLLMEVETDMTIFYRQLALYNPLAATKSTEFLIPDYLHQSYYQKDQLSNQYIGKLHHWLKQYEIRFQQEGSTQEERQKLMNSTNPKYVPRNYLAQMAIDKAEMGDYQLIHELLDVFRKPYDEQPGKEQFYQKRPEWAKNKAGCSMLS